MSPSYTLIGAKPLVKSRLIVNKNQGLTLVSDSNHKYLLQTKACNLLRPSDAYACLWTVSILVQIMVCRQFGVKPLSESTMTLCQWNQWEQFKWNWIQYTTTFIQENEFENVVCGKWRPFCLGLNVFDILCAKSAHLLFWSRHHGISFAASSGSRCVVFLAWRN